MPALRRARAQGKRLGRPRVITDAGKLRQLLATGVSCRAAARSLGVSQGTVRRAYSSRAARSRKT
jgi:DNA invertase Pin-like site-specific DNA recombinase